MNSLLWMVVASGAALLIASGVITLARQQVFFPSRHRGRVRADAWRLSGWTDIVGGIGCLFLAAGVTDPLRLMPFLFAQWLVCQAVSIALMVRARPAREPRSVTPRPRTFREPRWWWYDSPVERDWLFWTMIAITALTFVAAIAAGQFGMTFAFLFPGCLVCALRNWYRMRRGPSRSDAALASGAE